MEYSLKEIELELDKEEFKKYIIVLKHYNPWGSFRFLENHKKIVRVITSMIAKYHSYSDWFFKTFLVYCLQEKDFIYYIYHNNDDVDEIYFTTEFSNIIHILRKCYTSEILEFIVEKNDILLQKAKNEDDWYNINSFFNYNLFTFVYEFVLQISNNIKIPYNINTYNTITEQLLYMIVSKYKSFKPSYLKNYYD